MWSLSLGHPWLVYLLRGSMYASSAGAQIIVVKKKNYSNAVVELARPSSVFNQWIGHESWTHRWYHTDHMDTSMPIATAWCSRLLEGCYDEKRGTKNHTGIPGWSWTTSACLPLKAGTPSLEACCHHVRACAHRGQDLLVRFWHVQDERARNAWAFHSRNKRMMRRKDRKDIRAGSVLMQWAWIIFEWRMLMSMMSKRCLLSLLLVHASHLNT